ncbi:hypothetical protein QUG02_09775 [Bacillus hominis]|uniref:Uncharacterized protein n=1 Tax=Bacillus hominis TaxID=2817478 RepID=A0ABT7R656_9BACI|nr:hypothetical protein [Bacillus hominis]MDM5193268.1 hypothetical protein [Bacillus hominis]MDM5432990.1 hypothetical protein [Bacillus hominis]MDM5438412.1 hypothetical protein [Bacillus hominis]
MPSIQDTIYPKIKQNLSTEDLSSVYMPTRSEIEWTSLKTKGTLQQLPPNLNKMFNNLYRDLQII